MLNSNFASAYELKPASGSRYFLDLVLGFCNDMEAGLRELALTLYIPCAVCFYLIHSLVLILDLSCLFVDCKRELPIVDYEYMFEHCMKIRRSAIR